MPVVPPSAGYTPGVCNINPTEIAYRRKAGYMGVVITLLILVPLLIFHVSPFWRLVIALPLFLAALGFLQAKNHFCVSYAASGLENAVGDTMKGAKKVSTADHAKDTHKATRMYVQAGGVSIILAALSVLLPHL